MLLGTGNSLDTGITQPFDVLFIDKLFVATSTHEDQQYFQGFQKSLRNVL
jgi:hypothetical protein